jgi:hypothetical protein
MAASLAAYWCNWRYFCLKLCFAGGCIRLRFARFYDLAGGMFTRLYRFQQAADTLVKLGGL